MNLATASPKISFLSQYRAFFIFEKGIYERIFSFQKTVLPFGDFSAPKQKTVNNAIIPGYYPMQYILCGKLQFAPFHALKITFL
jgi:hypothetical protein